MSKPIIYNREYFVAQGRIGGNKTKRKGKDYYKRISKLGVKARKTNGKRNTK